MEGLPPLIDLTNICDPPPSPALQRQRRTAETERYEQSQRRSRQMEEEIAKAIEAAGAATPSIKKSLHQDINKIALRLTSSRKERMASVDEINMINKSPTKSTPSGLVTAVADEYKTPVKHFRHYSLISPSSSSSSSIQHVVAKTAKSERKRRTAEKQRRMDSQKRLSQLKLDIYSQVVDSTSVFTSSTSPSPSVTPSAIAQDIDKSLQGVKNRLEQGRARFTLLESDDLNHNSSSHCNRRSKSRSNSRSNSRSSSLGNVCSSNNSNISRGNSAEKGESESAKDLTDLSDVLRNKCNNRQHKKQIWYKEHRSSLLALVIIVALVAIVLPIRHRSLNLINKTSEISLTESIDSISDEYRMDDDMIATTVDINGSTTKTPTVLFVMFVATCTWVYAAYHVLLKRLSNGKKSKGCW
jgi:hypothetical protein